MRFFNYVNSGRTNATITGLAPGAVYYAAIVPVIGYGDEVEALAWGEAVKSRYRPEADIGNGEFGNHDMGSGQRGNQL